MLRNLILSAMSVALAFTFIEAKTNVTSEPFGKLPDGTAVEVYTLKSATIEARVITYGGILLSLKAPDRNSKMSDVVLGFDGADGYYANSNNPGTAYFGALIGRYANRIGHATFALDGKKYSLSANNNGN